MINCEGKDFCEKEQRTRRWRQPEEMPKYRIFKTNEANDDGDETAPKPFANATTTGHSFEREREGERTQLRSGNKIQNRKLIKWLDGRAHTSTNTEMKFTRLMVIVLLFSRRYLLHILVHRHSQNVNNRHFGVVDVFVSERRFVFFVGFRARFGAQSQRTPARHAFTLAQSSRWSDPSNIGPPWHCDHDRDCRHNTTPTPNCDC